MSIKEEHRRIDKLHEMQEESTSLVFHLRRMILNSDGVNESDIDHLIRAVELNTKIDADIKSVELSLSLLYHAKDLQEKINN